MRFWFVLVVLGLAGVWTPATGVEVLAPAPGARASADGVWLVIRAPAPPAVSLGDTPAVLGVSEGEIHHYRLGPLNGGTAAVRIGDGPDLALGGGTAGFHEGTAPACWGCHDDGNEGCEECHTAFGGGKHRPVLAEGCVRCHLGPHRSPGSPQELCVGCHPKYGGGRHGKVRHAVSSQNDPLRPGRAMDCASCHDPHAPRCLSCLPRGELRSWCKRCHGGP